MQIKPKAILRELVIIAVIVAAAFYGNRLVQTWLGQKAIEQAGYEQISFDAAKALANTQGKPMLVDFSAVWCPSCRKLDTKVFANPAVKMRIEQDYVYVRLEYESDDRALFERYGVTGFPTLLLMDAAGNPYQRLGFTLDPEQFLTQL